MKLKNTSHFLGEFTHTTFEGANRGAGLLPEASPEPSVAMVQQLFRMALKQRTANDECDEGWSY
jgi:hypothetical protein